MPTPQEASPTTTNPSTPTPVTFSSLPFELREKIWKSTFEPRLLSIYMHDGQTPSSPALASASEPHFQRQPTKTACKIYTAALGISAPYHWQDLIYPQRNFKGHFTIAPYMKIRLPRGPVALEVCRESREIALKRYELAFAGRNLVPGDEKFEEEWKEGGYGEKRIWVDFKGDVLFIWNAKGKITIQYPPGAYKVERLVSFAQRSMIRRLAIGVEWAEPREPQGDSPTPPVFSRLSFYFIMRTLKLLKELEELFVVPQRGQTFTVLSEEEAEMARRDIVNGFGGEMEKYPWREGRVPEVTIIRDLAIYNKVDRYTVWVERREG